MIELATQGSCCVSLFLAPSFEGFVTAAEPAEFFCRV